MENIFWCGCCSLLIFVAEKAGKGTELQFLCSQGTLQGALILAAIIYSSNTLHI